MKDKKRAYYYLAGQKGKRSGYIYSEKEHRLVISLIESNPEAVKKEISKPFEYENKLEWCPDIKGFCAYVLMCEDGRMYKGFTEHFKNRMLAHFNGGGCITTKKHKPAYILHHEEYDSKETAKTREIFFKSSQGFQWLKNTLLLKTIKPC